MSDEELAVLRKARNAALQAFNTTPTDETKAQYQAAQSAYSAARHQIEDPTRSWPSPVVGLPDEVDEARVAANAASREMYANPGPETREAWRLAKNKYQNLRRKLDPEFKAKHIAASKKSKAKKAVGPHPKLPTES